MWVEGLYILHPDPKEGDSQVMVSCPFVVVITMPNDKAIAKSGVFRSVRLLVSQCGWRVHVCGIPFTPI